MSTIRAPHRPRRVRFHDRQDWAGNQMKIYTIAAADRAVTADVLAVACVAARAAVPAPDPDAGRPGAGFVVVHVAGELGYVLAHWWARANEIHQRMFSAPLDRWAELAPHPEPAIGCVWELAVVEAERRAWLTHVLAPPRPDLDAYLDTRYDDEF